MYSIISAISILLAIVSSTSPVKTSSVVELDEGNFEHLTQLNSGATTGDWFVKFYAPWCGHCKRLAPVWEEVATELKGKVNVAKVDVTQNRALGKQFGVKGFPTLLLFRRGKMVKYSGARTKEALTEWAVSAEGTDDLPGPIPITEKALSGVVKVLEDLIGVLNKFPIPSVILVIGGLLIGIMLGAIMCGGSVEYREKEVIKYVQQPQKEAQTQPQTQANGPPVDEPTPTDPKTKKDN